MSFVKGDERGELPSVAMEISPGYPWERPIDVKFNDVRPNDWPLWTINMRIFCLSEEVLHLTNGSGVEIESVELDEGAFDMPVFKLTAAQTELARTDGAWYFVIDLQEPGGVPKDYFTGQFIVRTTSPGLAP